MNSSVSSRRAVREAKRGQLFLGISSDDAQMIFAMQKLIDLALLARFVMLFAVFTRINTSLFLDSRKNVLRGTKRAERILRMADKFQEFELTRRRRYIKRLKEKEQYGASNLQTN